MALVSSSFAHVSYPVVVVNFLDLTYAGTKYSFFRLLAIQTQARLRRRSKGIQSFNQNFAFSRGSLIDWPAS